jgi:thymidylate synthase
MKSFYCESIPRKYSLILESILQEGKQVGPRGMKTMELSPVYMEATNPRERLFGHEHRKEVSIFTYIEGLWILMGESKPDRLLRYVKHMAEFVNPETGKLDGAYGPAIDTSLVVPNPLAPIETTGAGYKNFAIQGVNQFKRAYDILSKDKESRQAVVTINNPLLHSLPTKDFPCTLDFQFLIRDGKLDMISHMRSQDAWWGLVYDSGEFQWFQEIMAGWLNVDLGSYKHFVGSLHLYEKDWEAARDVVVLGDKSVYERYNIKLWDARLDKVTFDSFIKALAEFEKFCRDDEYNTTDTFAGTSGGQLISGNYFYENLANIIAAYNLRLNGKKEEASMMVKGNGTDLGRIYNGRWAA